MRLTINQARASQDFTLDFLALVLLSFAFSLAVAHSHVLIGLPNQLHKEFPNVCVRFGTRLYKTAVPRAGS